MALFTDPFREMDRLVSSVLRQAPAAAAMPLDLYRTGESFVAQIDLPGVDPSTIDVDIQWLSHERPTGTFARQLVLGNGLALDRIDADYADGVLTLTIPVAEEAKPRKIHVSHAPRTIEQQASVAEPAAEQPAEEKQLAGV